MAGLECDPKIDGCVGWYDQMSEQHHKPPPRPTPECRIREDCRWCGDGFDVTEYCKDGLCLRREPDDSCLGKKNGWKVKGGSC